jgi:hypothetical protein
MVLLCSQAWRPDAAREMGAVAKNLGAATLLVSLDLPSRLAEPRQTRE